MGASAAASLPVLGTGNKGSIAGKDVASAKMAVAHDLAVQLLPCLQASISTGEKVWVSTSASFVVVIVVVERSIGSLVNISPFRQILSFVVC